MSAPLTPNDTAVLLFDLQESVVELSKTVEVLSIRRATEWLLRCARRFDIPVVVSTAGVPGESGPVRVVPEIEEVLGSGLAHHVPGRPTANAFTHPPAASKIASLGRKTLLIGGVLTEVAIQNTALSGAKSRRCRRTENLVRNRRPLASLIATGKGAPTERKLTRR